MPDESTTTQRVFILRDFALTKIKDTLEEIRDFPPEGHEIEIPGFGTEQRQGAIFWDYVQPQIDSVDKVIALVDLPNANVGLELGYALGKQKPTALVTVRDKLPVWITEDSPFSGHFVSNGQSVSTLEAQIERPADDEASWIPSLAPTTKGETTLFVCPHRNLGETYHRSQKRVAPDWRVLPEKAWVGKKLPDILEGVGRVVWVITPIPDHGEERDGRENTICSVVAGYALGLGLDLEILRSEESRDVVDVAGHAWDFASTKQFRERLGELVNPVAEAARPATQLETYYSWLVRHHSNLPTFF